MLKSWYAKYITLMGSLLLITIGYNNCSNDAAFDLKEGVESLEQFDEDTRRANEPPSNPTVLINNGADFTREKVVNLTLNPDKEADQMLISNSRDCADGSWEAYRANKLWVLDKENQKAEVYAKYRLNGDDESGCVKDDIVHDNEPPVVAFTQGVGSVWIADRDINISYEAIDGVSGVKATECDQEGQGQFMSCGKNIFYTALEENVNNLLVVRATDNAGNVSAPQQLNFRSDQTPPTVGFTSTPSSVTSDTTPDFVLLGNDLGSGIGRYECKLDQETVFKTCKANHTINGLADGVHTLVARAVDNVGRMSSEISYTWTQDSTAPTIEFTQTPGPIVNNLNSTFAFREAAGTNDVVSYRCKLDSGAYEDCTSPNSVAVVGDGKHTFSVLGQDSAGNTSAQPISYTWLVDTTKPTIRFTEVPRAYESSDSARVSFEAQDTGSGVKGIECRLDSGAFKACNSTEQFTGLSGGQHTVYARAIDIAGNVSDPISYSWNIDNVAPTVTITKSPDNPTSQTTGEFRFEATDGGNGSGVNRFECRLDGGAYKTCTSPTFYNNLANGEHTFYVRAYDNAGNVSPATSYQWLVDLKPPVISFVLSPNDPTYVGEVGQVRFIAEDTNGSGIQSATCTYNQANYNCDIDMTYNFQAQTEGAHEFVVTVTDRVGNTATSKISWTTKYQVVDKAHQIQVMGDRPVDILFVVDVSGSMNAERANLGQRINGFLDKLDGLDWQVAATSTDLYGDRDFEDGRITSFSGTKAGPYILDSTMDKAVAQQQFGDRIQNMPEGDGNEQGIYATVRTIQRALHGRGDNSRNAQFIRDGADLAVVVLSDEDENSNGNKPKYTPEEFLAFVDQSYAGKKNITWHSIITIPGDTVCKESGYSFYGVLYDKLSRLTGYGQPGGAMIGSVCDSNYTAQLADIGQSVQDMQKAISLECAPFDADGDGVIDMEVTYKAQGAASYQPFNEPYNIQGQKIVFDNFLPIGDFNFKFKCTQ